MKIKHNDPARIFNVGKDKNTEISDCAKIWLENDEQVTFVTKSGKQYDLAAKDWGFYATPSINGRLRREGFRAALVMNPQGRYYVMIVEIEKIKDFEDYLKAEGENIREWLGED